MENIRFDFSDFHQHGRAFYEFLQLRKRVFVDAMKWDVPHNASVEMDQYDTPLAYYSVVMRDGVVVGGARTMATTSVWGEHTYMLRDAWSGKLPHIPRHVMSVEIASPEVWECTRLVISDQLVSQADRSECLAMRQLGYEVSLLGEAYRSGEDGRKYGVMKMPTEYSHMRRAMAEHSSVVTGFASRRSQTIEAGYGTTEMPEAVA